LLLRLDEATNDQEQVTLKQEEIFMLRAFKRLSVTLVILFFMTGCQAMTGQTMGEQIDDSYITGAVKTKLASDKLVSLTRVEIETNNGVVYLTGQVQSAEQRSHVGSVASQVKGVKRVVNNLQVINR
jgi:hyperosmotically inducible protein